MSGHPAHLLEADFCWFCWSRALSIRRSSPMTFRTSGTSFVSSENREARGSAMTMNKGSPLAALSGRPKAELILADKEREQLSRWTAGTSPPRRSRCVRSRIVLACAEGMTNKYGAALIGCSAPTMTKWRSRFVEHRLNGLSDDPRPGRPATISTDQVEDIVVATLESTPENATHWSRSKMAERNGLFKSTVGRIWKAFSSCVG